MARGFIKTINQDRGFGFIACETGGDLFFHVGQLDPALDFDGTLVERRVEFEQGIDERSGKSRAVNVRPAV